MGQISKDPDAELDDAAQSIIDDYLSTGDFYPPKGGRESVTMGDFLADTLDDEDMTNALTAIACGNGEALDSLQHRFWNINAADGDLVRWLREKRPNLVQLRIEELREEAAERFEVAA
jgi:hypothetical protein